MKSPSPGRRNWFMQTKNSSRAPREGDSHPTWVIRDSPPFSSLSTIELPPPILICFLRSTLDSWPATTWQLRIFTNMSLFSGFSRCRAAGRLHSRTDSIIAKRSSKLQGTQRAAYLPVMLAAFRGRGRFGSVTGRC